MKRTLVGSFAVVLCACGSVPKQKADGGVDAAVDASPDAFNCNAFPVSGNFTFSPASPGINSPVTFTPATSGLTYAWTFTDGTPPTSTDAAPQVTWTAAGPHAVSLAATDPANHCMGSSMQNVTVLSCAAPVSGPTPTTATGGWNNYGVVFMPTRNTTLTSFTITGKGLADTIQLTDANGTVLQTLSMPAGSATYQASVSWPVVANQSYHLLSTAGDNLSWIQGAFPYNGASVNITGGWGNGGAQTYYFGFTNLVSCP